MNDIMIREIGVGSSMISNEQMLNDLVTVGIGKGGIQITADGDPFWGLCAMGILAVAGGVILFHDILK